MSKRRYFQIAIDGPVGAGKSTVARLVAERLGFLYVYTGAMYRAAALLSKQQGVDWSGGRHIAKLLENAKMEMRMPLSDERDGRIITFLLNNKDVTWDLVTEDISRGGSIVSAHKDVREVLVRKQQELAHHQDVVMEGRDITFRVLPDAQLKIFLTASEEERARRKLQQTIERGKDSDFDFVLKELQERDKRDTKRNVDPLQIVPDAWVLDTSDMTIEGVAENIIRRVERLRGLE